MVKSYKLSRNSKNSLDSHSQVTVPVTTKEQRDELERFLKNTYNIEIGKKRRITFLLDEGIFIPVSIFKTELSPLESVVFYLYNQNLRLSEIGRKLNRNQRTIWITLRNARKKNANLELTGSQYIPLSVFSDRKLSILEHVCVYLKEQGFKLKEIASLLNKAPNTVWTCYSRARKKNE